MGFENYSGEKVGQFYDPNVSSYFSIAGHAGAYMNWATGELSTAGAQPAFADPVRQMAYEEAVAEAAAVTTPVGTVVQPTTITSSALNRAQVTTVTLDLVNRQVTEKPTPKTIAEQWLAAIPGMLGTPNPTPPPVTTIGTELDRTIEEARRTVDTNADLIKGITWVLGAVFAAWVATKVLGK